MATFLIDAREPPPIATVVLAHGAGAPMDSPFMSAMAKALSNHDIRTLRFEFDYMAARREGARKPPPKMPELMHEFETALVEVAAHEFSGPLLIGGKSMGGRVASMIATAEFAAGRIGGCVCLGYPFHPAGKPTQLRTAHLGDLTCPTLIIQGERDPLGDKSEVPSYPLSNWIDVIWITDGDHDLKPRVKSGSTHAEAIETAATAIALFAQKRSQSRRQ